MSLLCQPSFRCKVGVKDFICTRWQRLSAVKYRRPGRSIGPFVTITNNIITELNITLQNHHTLESDFSLTIDDKFHSCSLLLEIHRVGEPSLTSLISHRVPPPSPPPHHLPKFASLWVDLLCRRLEPWDGTMTYFRWLPHLLKP